MPRRLVPLVPNAYYHIYNRGNNRQKVFFQQENYLYFLEGLKRYVLPAADILVYCLMPTHYHLMVRVKQTAEVSLGMMKLSVSYTKAINKRFARVGVLFQGPFQARPILDSRHLFHLCRYVHANPVKDGLVNDPFNWPYSNYLEWIGERNGSLFDPCFVQKQFPNPGEYKDFVMDYLQTRKMPEDVIKYLGSIDA
jgi:putative transposase